VNISLKGRSALITGGSEGLGKAMAVRFAASGADVVIMARRTEQLAIARAEIEMISTGKVYDIPCDLMNGPATLEAFSDAQTVLGGIDILVNNAGTSRAKKFEHITDDEWQEDLDLKLMAAIRLCRAALPGMKERKWGRIINVLNIGAKAPKAAGAPTVVSRAAGLALTKVLAGDAAPFNVLVNALMVGLIKSGQWERAHSVSGAKISYEQFVQKMADDRKIPLGRIGEAEEFANIACFLASEQASFITGASINVDGGASPIV